MKAVGHLMSIALVAGIVLLVGAGQAGAAFTFDLFETVENTATGTPCDVCSVLELPEAVQGGYVILFETDAGTLEDPTTWSDVVVFGNEVVNGILHASDATVGQVQLLSEGCQSGQAGDVSCFPSLDQILSVPFATLVETDPPPTVYFASPNTYNIWSEGPDGSVPEPAVVMLLGAGLAGLSLIAWRRRR